MVPLRFVSEALGARVVWNGASKIAAITTSGQQVAGARTINVPAEAIAIEALRMLERDGRIIDCDATRRGGAEPGTNWVMPDWLRDEPRAWREGNDMSLCALSLCGWSVFWPG